MSWTFRCTWRPRAAHGLYGSVLLNHKQRMRNAQPRMTRLCIPRPPRSRGLQNHSQATEQWPPRTSSRPFQRKARLLLSIIRINQPGTSKAISRWIGTAVRTALTSTNRPAKLKRPAFQPGSISEIRSTTGCRSSLESFLTESGKPCDG